MTVCVLHAAAEMYPLLKTGGLADVVGALPPAQSQLGTHARVVLPGFPAVLAGLADLEPVADLGGAFGAGNVRLERGVLKPHGVIVYVVRADRFYDRPGNPYMDAANHPYADNDRRFALLGWAAARIATGADPAWKPHIVHAHDWHAGLAPAYLRAFERGGAPRVASVMTVHNLAYQGTFPAADFGLLQLPADFYAIEGLEFYGHVSFLKAGLYYADRITTVSPTYAREIQTQAHGAGLHGLLQTRTHDIAGILNGVDYSIWSPAVDDAIASKYTAAKPASGKSKCKAALQERMGLAKDDDALLFGVVSRLTEQKGLDLLLSAVPDIVQRGGQLAVLGTGDPALETGMKNAAAAHPGAVAVELGFDETLSHSIIAGSDVVMVPSRFEPCGLTQLYALAYGSLPLVHRVGGLADTVVDSSLENLADDLATGFVFDSFDRAGIVAAIRRAFALKARRTDWKAVVKRAMGQNFGWEAAALQYAEVYQGLLDA